jgi:hypothetical protein
MSAIVGGAAAPAGDQMQLLEEGWISGHRWAGT